MPKAPFTAPSPQRRPPVDPVYVSMAAAEYVSAAREAKLAASAPIPTKAPPNAPPAD